jgi:small subunit ribosomal protein S20
MANHASAKKRIRQTERRTEVNRQRIGTIRTGLRKVEEAIEGGDKAIAESAFRAAQPQMMSGVSKGVLHANTVSRKLSRLSKRIKGLPA